MYSQLATYVNLSPNCTKPRKSKIDTVTVHCYVGQVTAKRGCDGFAQASRQASSNYVVGYDGSIGCSVDESNRSWCSGGKDKNGNPIRVNGISGADNDHRAITIEVASDTKDPYTITAAAYNSLIDLLTDICRRNGIPELRWKADKTLVGRPDLQNMTVHRWFANKACPGDYIYNRLGEIATKVNARLQGGNSAQTGGDLPEGDGNLYRIRKEWDDPASQIGAFRSLYNAKRFLDESPDGYSVFDSQGRKVYPSEEYRVEISVHDLNIRKGPGTNYATTGRHTGKGIFTIIQEASGAGASKGWGLLKSRAGWVSLDYCRRL